MCRTTLAPLPALRPAAHCTPLLAEGHPTNSPSAQTLRLPTSPLPPPDLTKMLRNKGYPPACSAQRKSFTFCPSPSPPLQS